MHSNSIIIFICIFVFCIIVHLDASVKSSKLQVHKDNKRSDLEVERINLQTDIFKIQSKFTGAQMHEKMAKKYHRYGRLFPAGINYHAAGNAYKDQDDQGKAVEMYIKAAAAFKEYKDYHLEAESCKSAAQIYEYLGFNSDAIKYYKLAIAAYSNSGLKTEIETIQKHITTIE